MIETISFILENWMIILLIMIFLEICELFFWKTSFSMIKDFKNLVFLPLEIPLMCISLAFFVEMEKHTRAKIIYNLLPFFILGFFVTLLLKILVDNYFLGRKRT